MRFMNNKSESNLIPTVSDEPFGYICPSSKAAEDPSAGWDLNPNELNPNFVTGFSDAESCFIIDVFKQKNWRMAARFIIHLHSIDLPLLYKIQSFFGGIGSVTVNGQTASFRVSKLEHIINVVIPHFDKYPLQSAKLIDFQLWKECVILIKNKEHLTESGLDKILSLKSALNLGLSANLSAAFPNVIAIARPLYTGPSAPLNPHWVSGFVEGDGSFTTSLEPTTSYVKVRLIVGLNHRENLLIQKLLEFFCLLFSSLTPPLKGARGEKGVGRIHLSPKQEMVYYTVSRIKDWTSLIVPHFDSYELTGNKANNYLIWREILLKVNSKAHLTSEGSNQIQELRSKLNKYPERDMFSNPAFAGLIFLYIKKLTEGDDPYSHSNSLSLSYGETSPEEPARKLCGGNTPFLRERQFITKINPLLIKCRGCRSYSTKPYNNVNLLGSKPDEGGVNLITKRLSPYLAGLIEARGSIAVHDKNSKSKKYRPKIIIVFSLADKPLAEKLASILQAGKVICKPNTGHVLWQILAKEEVIKIINLINGYMRTPKIEALHRAICWLNENDNSSIDCLDLDLSPIDSNSWLAGFTDADGNFSITLSDRKKNGKVIRKSMQTFFRIELKQNYPREVTEKQGGNSYFNILTKISAFFTVNLYTRTRYKNNKVFYTFMIISHNSRSHEIAIAYFDKFPLLSNKALDYADWREVVLKFKDKEFLQPQELEHIKIIKERLNKPRQINSIGCNYNFYMSDYT